MSYGRVKAIDELAKEFRRASWGAAAASAGFSYTLGSGLAAFFAGSIWFILQAVAFFIQSKAVDEKGE